MQFISGLKVWGLLLTVVWVASCSSGQHCAPVVNLSTKGKSKPINLQNYTVVRSGDTLFTVAARNKIAPQTLALLNGVRPPYAVYPGQKLYLSTQQSSIHRVPSKQTQSPSLVSSSSFTAGKSHSQTQSLSKKVMPALKQSPLGCSTGDRLNSNHGKVPMGSQQKQVNREVASLIHWQWPVRGPLLRRFHQDGKGKGIDIGGSMGAPVKAAAKGIVVYSGNALKGYGNLIIIKHNEDFLSAYAHNRELKVKEGECVHSGQEIAAMGKTDAEQVKLHFEIRYKGKPVDPIQYLAKH